MRKITNFVPCLIYLIGYSMKDFSISADTRAHLDLLNELQEHYNNVYNLIGESQELDEAFVKLKDVEAKFLLNSILSNLEQNNDTSVIQI